MYLANGDKSFSKERIEVFSGGKIAVLDDFRTLQLIENGRKINHKSRLRQDKGHSRAWTTFISAIQDNTGPPIPYDQLIGGMHTTIIASENLNKGIIQVSDYLTTISLG